MSSRVEKSFRASPLEVRADFGDVAGECWRMSEPAIDGIRIEEHGDHVIIDVPGGRWEGSAAEAERLLTHLQYVLARARPGTNIVSMFVNGELWGGKTIETDPARALNDVREILDQLSAHIPKLVDQANRPVDPD